MRRILLSVTAALVWLGVAAAPASAHSVSGVSATSVPARPAAASPSERRRSSHTMARAPAAQPSTANGLCVIDLVSR